MVTASEVKAQIEQGRREFVGLELEGEKLDKFDLSGLIFRDCLFAECTFRSVDCDGARFERCRAQNADFSFGEFSEAVFTTCNLTLSHWRGADVAGTRFEDCKLLGANFSEARALGLEFTRCKLNGAILKKTSFRKRLVEGLDFTDADLAGCDFRQAELVGCQFRGAHLATASFKDADLRSSDLGDLTFATAGNFRGAIISRDQATEILRNTGLRVM